VNGTEGPAPPGAGPSSRRDNGQRPYRVHIDPANDGSKEVSDVADRIRREFLTRVDLDDLLTPAYGASTG
jgi:hypothetical protein